MAKTPRPHQATAFEKTKSLDRFGLFWEMRLGKTLVVLNWLRNLDVRKVLILCPKAVIDEWLTQSREENIHVVELTGDHSERLARVKRRGRYFVTNYESLHEITTSVVRGKRKRDYRPSPLSAYPWDAVVLDESTRIRKPKALVTKTALKQFSRVQRKALMSGLANPEGCEDFVTQLIFLFGECMGCASFYDWQRRHMTKLHFGPWVVFAKSRKKLVNEVAKKCFVLRRKDAGYFDTYVRKMRTVDLPSKVMKAIRQAQEEFRVGDILVKHAIVALQLVARLAGGRFPEDENLHHDTKFIEVRDLLRGDLQGEKVVVWCAYSDEIQACCELLNSSSICARSFFGRNKDSENRKNVRSFKYGRAQVLVAQGKKAALGLNFSVASAAIYVSNWYDYEIRRQSEDRILNVDDPSPLLLLDIAARGTTDMAAARALRRKGTDSGNFLERVIESAKEIAA